MTDKEFGKLVKDITAVLKKVVDDSADSPNALELYKFLQKTHTNALTFDKTHPTYKNYLVLSMKPKKAKEPKEEAPVEDDETKPARKKQAKDTAADDANGAKKKKATAALDESVPKVAKKPKSS